MRSFILRITSFKFKSSLLRCLQPLRYDIFLSVVVVVISSDRLQFFFGMFCDYKMRSYDCDEERQREEIEAEIGLDQKLIGSKLNHNSIAEMRQTSTVFSFVHSYTHSFEVCPKSKTSDSHFFNHNVFRLAHELFLLYVCCCSSLSTTGYSLITAL